jgi:hypothetical protein
MEPATLERPRQGHFIDCFEKPWPQIPMESDDAVNNG